MPRLLGPLLLLLPERRLVNQEIGPLRRIDDRRAGPRVTGEHHQPPRTLRSHNPLGTHGPPVRQSDCLAPLQLPPQVSFRNAGRPRLLRIEPPGTFVLLERVPDRPPTVLRGEGVDRIPVAAGASANLPRLDFNDLNLEGNSLHSELDRLAEYLLRAFRAIQHHGLRPRLKSERADQSDHPEKMVGVKMREEDLRQREAHPVAHHLALGALAALEQESLAFAHEGDTGDIPLYGGTGG